MSPLIRVSLVLFFLCLIASDVFAGDLAARPVKHCSFHFKNIVGLDSFLNARVSALSLDKKSVSSPEEAPVSAGRICSCQILNLESSNYDHRYVVLLAEKTNDGTELAYSIARDRIRKEKKHLRQMFYDKVKVVSEMQGTGSCKSMYFRLRTADKNLQLYEILNADIK